ncbi:RES domain-containing protein, partial [Mycobacterium tuberculosis]|nr:RES domain-containing protein [Mycobacterium tuberculosis]
HWTHPTDYAACQALADAARAAEIAVLRYASVRDPGGGANVAVLTAAAFAVAEPVERRTWRLKLTAAGVLALCDFPPARLAFARAAFADPR